MSENKWTNAGAGPRQIKAVNDALRCIRWEGKTVVEITGVIGGEERRSAHIPMVTGGLSEFAAAAYEQLGAQFGWSVTAINANQVVKAAEALLPAVKANPIVHDLRITPEQDAENRRQRSEADQQREVEGQARAAEVERITAELRARYPWAAGIKAKGLSPHATAAACMKHELGIAFPGITFRVKSDSFAGGNCVDIYWILGPTTKQVEAITGKYQYGSFNGMQDIYEHDNSAESTAVGRILAQAKYVSENRSFPDALYAQIEADLRPHCHASVDVARERSLLIDRTSFGPGETYAGIGHDEDREFVILKQGTPTLPPRPHGSPDGASSGARCHVEQHAHTKRNITMHIVVLDERVERAEFETLRARCQARGGWYSRQWGRTPGGFAFEDAGAAQTFADGINSASLVAA